MVPATVKKQTPEEYYNRIINESPYVAADTTEFMSVDSIPWLDMDLVREGVEFINRHYMAIYSAITGASLLGLAFRPIAGILLRHSKHYDPEFAYRRHLSGMERLFTWFDEDIYTQDPTDKNSKLSKGIQNFNYVRRTHAGVVKKTSGAPLPKLETFGESTLAKKEFIEAIHADLEFVEMDPPKDILTWDPVVPLSQFSMVATQFAGISGVMIKHHAEKLGITDMRGLEGYMHIEALIGRMMGIHDEFNLGLHGTPEFCERFFTNVILPSTKFSDEITITLEEAFVKGMTNSPYITLKSLTYLAMKSYVPNFQGDNLYKILNLKEKLGVILLNSTTWGFVRIPFAKQAGNYLAKRFFDSNLDKYVRISGQ